MVAPAYTTDLTTMDEAESETDWDEATASGWTAVFAVSGGDTDDFIQNSACNSSTFKTGVGVLLYDNGGGITLNQDDAVLIWAKWDSGPGLDTDANGGMRTVMGNGLGAFNSFDQSGSDSYTYGGWKNFATGDPADSEVTPDDVVGGPNTTKQFHGWAAAALSVPSKGNPYKVDVIRYGRCEIRVNGGETADFANAAGMAAVNDDNSDPFNRWGLFQAVDGGYLWKGLMTLGFSSAVDFRDSNAFITVDDTPHCTQNFNKIEIDQASSRVDWTGYTFVSLGTKSPGRFEMLAAADLNWVSCSFSDMDTFIFGSTASVLATQFLRCSNVTADGADFSGSSLLEPNIAANTSALIWDVNTDPSGLLDDMTFSKTSGTAHHAIEFGTAIADAQSFTLNGIDFGTDFSSTQGGSTGDETFHFLDTTGSITLNLIDCSGNFGYRTEGVAVDIVIAPVVTKITVEEADGTMIENARVFLETADDGGGTGFPFAAATDSLTQSGGVAELTASGVHGLATNDYVVVRGAGEQPYNRTAQITVTSTTVFTYPVDSGATTPAGGTPVFSYMPISTLTDSNGEVASSKSWPASQGLKGWARKSSSSPFFKQTAISIADASGGTDLLLALQPDE